MSTQKFTLGVVLALIITSCKPISSQASDTVTFCASIASIVLTFALVAITFYYAIQTRKTVEEMEKSRRLSAVPVITFDLEVNQNRKNLPGLFNKLTIQNMGNSPALETVISLKQINSETSRVQIRPPERNPGVIGINQQKIEEINADKDEVTKLFEGKSSQPRLELTSYSQNSYGIISKTVAEFELQIIKLQQEGGFQNQPVWKKLSEHVTVEK